MIKLTIRAQIRTTFGMMGRGDMMTIENLSDQQEIWRAQAREDYELHERQREFMIAKVMREKEEAEQKVADLLRENELLKKKLLEAESH